MSLWTWVLTGLCVVGVVVALVPVIPVLRLLLRLRSRVNEMQRSRLFSSMQLLELQRRHLQNIAREAAPLSQRAQRALRQLRAAPEDAGYVQVRDALHATGAEINALFEALR
jgi:hypothetical protein